MKIDCAYDALISIDKLVKHPRNNNRHSIEQIETLSKLIDAHGFRNALVVSNRSGYIVSGHGRLEAALKLGIKELPVDYQDFASEAEEYQCLTADNEIARWAQLDYQNIYDTLKEITDIDVSLLGIENFKLPEEELIPQCDEDEVPEAPIVPKTKRGDIFELGNHRLMCGDSTMIDDIEKLMNGEKAKIVFTSPPYNANTKAGDGDIFNGKKSKKLYSEGYSDNLESSQYLDFVKTVLENCFIFTQGFIFWNVSYNAKSRFEYIKQIENRISFLIEQICWKKTSTIPFKGSLMRDWEPIYLFSTNGEKLGLDEVCSNHWVVSNQNAQQENHKACFPIELPEKGILIASKEKDILFEPFCGAGSSLIACEKTNRKCYGMELDGKYCDVVINRWQKYTGKKAYLLKDNEKIEFDSL